MGKLDVERLEELVVADIEEKEAIPIIRTNDTLAEMTLTISLWSSNIHSVGIINVVCNV